MVKIETIMISVTGLLIFSTIVCGLWLRYSGEEINYSNLNFHMILGILTALSTIITIYILGKQWLVWIFKSSFFNILPPLSPSLCPGACPDLLNPPFRVLSKGLALMAFMMDANRPAGRCGKFVHGTIRPDEGIQGSARWRCSIAIWEVTACGCPD